MGNGQNTPDSEELVGFIQRLERIRAAKDDLSDSEKVVFAEAKKAGYLPKAIRWCLKVRKLKPDEVREDRTIKDVYLSAIGLGSPVAAFQAIQSMKVDIASRKQVIDALKTLAPQGGDFIVRIGDQPVRIWRDKDGEPHVEDYVVAEPDPFDPSVSEDMPDARPPKDVPEVDDAGAYELGREYARNNRAVIENPFPFGDTRRAKFDEGWRDETGNDGMGPED